MRARRSCVVIGLTGQGVYESLSALFDRAFDLDTMAVVDGFIFEGKLPSIPALEDTPAE